MFIFQKELAGLDCLMGERGLIGAVEPKNDCFCDRNSQISSEKAEIIYWQNANTRFVCHKEGGKSYTVMF